MPRRICQSIDDHEWVSDTLLGAPCYCQACGLKLEDADEAHVMEGIEEVESDDWRKLVDL